MPIHYSDSVYLCLTQAEDESKQLRLSLMCWLANGILIAVAVL